MVSTDRELATELEKRATFMRYDRILSMLSDLALKTLSDDLLVEMNSRKEDAK